MLKRLTAVILLFSFLLSSFSAYAAYAGKRYISSAGACVMDYDTGDVLYEHNGYTPLVPASMTKIMNMYCVYEAIENGEITLDTVVPISENVYRKSRSSAYQSVLPLYYDQTYTVDEMIGVVVTYSASGAAVALAELVGGSEEEFVKRMNDKAAQMGLDAYYYDSCGIASNTISPVSMAALARNIIRDYPDILNRSSKRSASFHGGSYKSTNHLFDTYYYSGADGLKTGTTSAAGYCFCGTAVRNGRRMISVTMSSSSGGQRFVDTAALLDYGFAVAAEKYGYIYFSDMRTFINGSELPTMLYCGSTPHAVIVAEDMQNYGFDVSYDSVSQTVNIKYNKDKPVTPIPLDMYKGKNGQVAFPIINGAGVNVVIDDGVKKHTLTDAYNIGGYVCISIDELQSIYCFEWKESENAAYIKAENRVSLKPALDGEELTSKSAYIMDFDTGNTIYEFDADTQKPVASIAKMMSVYVILDAVKNGELTLDAVVPISENVYALSRNESYKMMVNLEYDEKYTVDEMLDMIVIDSAAACVTAVAELLCGSESGFAERMNKKAAEIGIGSVFYNGTGVCLNPATDKENMMSAREAAVMARKMIIDYPQILERTRCASVDFHGKTYYNLNKLFTDYYYKGADGFKNGMTEASGYCMCATASLGGKRVITVTLPSASNEARFTDSIKMLDYGFKALGVDVSDTRAKPQESVTENTENVKVNIDGNYEVRFDDQQPVISNGRVLVPMRTVMELLGKTVEWDADARRAEISDGTTSIVLAPDSGVMLKRTVNPLDGNVSEEEVSLDTAPVIINGRLCMPLRAAAEAFGAAVIWEPETSTVLVIAGVC